MEDVMQDVSENEQVVSEGWGEELEAAASQLQAIYPDFDLSQMMADETFRGLVCGESTPTLRQVYEMLHPTLLVREQIETGVNEAISAAVEVAVARAVEQTEQNLLRHIKTRGMRPSENGKNASLGVRTHPAVHRLTRDERAKLAMMAQQGENIRL